MGKPNKIRVKSASKSAKRWKKGQSSSSNPVIKKHRDLARGRFFGPVGGKSTLTSEALELLNAGGHGNVGKTAEEKAESGTVNTWATNWTDCTNATFSRVHRYLSSNNIFHKEVLAALAAVAEVIKTQGGQETDTEYFAALMTALETITEVESLAAIAYLLSLVIKRVPVNVLKARFTEISKTLMDILGRHAESSGASLLKALLSCIATLLRAQDVCVWGDASTVHMYNGLLSFTMHPKPKVRKALKDCIAMVVRCSSVAEGVLHGGSTCHPAAVVTARYCLQQLEKVSGSGEPADIIHLLNLIKEVIASFPEHGLKSCCETILRLMTLSNVMVTGVCYEVLNAMFAMRPRESSLSAELNAKLITAMYDFMPNVNDIQLMRAWLTVMENAHTNLARLDAKLSIGHLPRLLSSSMSCLLSERRENAMTAKLTMQATIKACFGGLGNDLPAFIQSCDGNSPIHRIIRLLESGLGYQYHASWDLHLQVLGVAFDVLGKHCSSLFKKCLASMGSLRESHGFPYVAELDHAIGMAVSSMGPKAVVEALPLQAATSNVEDAVISRSWLLPVLSKSVCNTELSFFVTFFLPLAARFRDKAMECMRKQQAAQQKVYEALVNQLWSLLPGFCNMPTDVPKSFGGLAKTLGTIIKDRPDLRMIVMSALRKLISTCQNNVENRKEISKYGKNFIPILLNVFTSPPEAGHEKDTARMAVLETVKAYLPIIDKQLVHSLFDNCLERLKEGEMDVFKRNAVLDVAIAMVKYADRSELVKVFELVKPQLQAADKSIQKKAYRFLEEICSAEAQSCRQFVSDCLTDIQQLLITSLSSASSPAKAPRLRCLASLFRHLDVKSQDLLLAVVPEAILCTREVAERARTAAYSLLLEIGAAMERWAAAETQSAPPSSSAADTDEAVKQADAQRIRSEVASDYFQLVMAGLAGSVHMIHSTLLAMTRLLIEYRKDVSSALLSQLLDNCCVLLRSKSREIVQPALGFLKVIIGSFESTDLSRHLENVISSLVEMKDENKHHLRFKAKELYARLIRKFGYEVILKMVPDSHHKILQNIRKTQDRVKRKRELSRGGATLDGEAGNDDTTLPAMSAPPTETIDDILRDSDSELGEEDEKSRTKAAARRQGGVGSQRQAWLRDGADKVTDFLDQSMAKNLTASKPAQASTSQKGGKKKEAFKTAPDGRLIITEQEDEIEARSDVGVKSNLKRKQNRGGSPDLDMLMEEFEAKGAKTKKRKLDKMDDDGGMSESASMAALPTYQPGGRGIHRKLTDGADGSGKKGWKTGEEYRAKNAGGDMKRRGMPDPYAYVPLSAQSLNKRKQAKLKGQFKGLVGAARKGAQKGAKAMSMKKGKQSNKRHRR